MCTLTQGAVNSLDLQKKKNHKKPNPKNSNRKSFLLSIFSIFSRPQSCGHLQAAKPECCTGFSPNPHPSSLGWSFSDGPSPGPGLLQSGCERPYPDTPGLYCVPRPCCSPGPPAGLAVALLFQASTAGGAQPGLISHQQCWSLSSQAFFSICILSPFLFSSLFLPPP